VSLAQPVGLDRDAVIAAAIELLDEGGAAALSLTALARRLGVRTPSLYAHVAGTEGLSRDLAIEGVTMLADDLRTSVLGRSGRDALFSVANAYRTFAARHPALYASTIRDPDDDEELQAANARCTEALTAVLESFGVHGDDAVHLYRALWFTIHGFVTFEATRLVTTPGSIEDSFQLAIGIFADYLEGLPGLAARANARQGPRRSGRSGRG
jgi:AcrR family transcriptional regulator